jgi:methylated-DNA-[protein]-cysteine S-methyltransferase
MPTHTEQSVLHIEKPKRETLLTTEIDIAERIDLEYRDSSLNNWGDCYENIQTTMGMFLSTHTPATVSPDLLTQKQDEYKKLRDEQRMLHTQYPDREPDVPEEFMKTFTEKVKAVVAKIPIGKVMTYKEVARRAGNDKGSRAVGMIMSKNYNLQIFCHRVIRSDGKIGNYNRGGEIAKRALLIKEGAIK